MKKLKIESGKLKVCFQAIISQLSILNSQFSTAKGFTLLELIIVIAIVAVLAGVVTTNLLNSTQKATLSAGIVTILSDVRSAQVKTMAGDTQGNNAVGNYGVYFQPSGYTLFHSITYSANDPTNYVVDLDSNLQFTNITFPASQIVFATTSGELSNYIDGQNTVTVKDLLNNDQKVIQINRYGVITGVN